MVIGEFIRITFPLQLKSYEYALWLRAFFRHLSSSNSYGGSASPAPFILGRIILLEVLVLRAEHQ